MSKKMKGRSTFGESCNLRATAGFLVGVRVLSTTSKAVFCVSIGDVTR